MASRPERTRSAALAALLAAACGTHPDPAGADSDLAASDTATPCAPWSWENAGAPVLLTWCASCHGSGLTGAARAGAPPEVNLDTEPDALRWAARVEARVFAEAPTMPPATTLPADDLALLRRWLDCR
jgi:mono/diheme cytochrome c family protein